MKSEGRETINKSMLITNMAMFAVPVQGQESIAVS